MRILVVGAGAAGGYLGSKLATAGRDVTFLVRPPTRQRLASQGLRIRHDGQLRTLRVRAVTAADLDGPYEVVVLAVRTNAVAAAIADVRPAVGPDCRIVPLLNGLRHLSLLTSAFGAARPLGAATRLVASQLPDGTVDVVTPGIDMAIGQLDGTRPDELRRTAALLDVDDVTVTVRDDVLAAMWEKFAFITSTAILTCLVGDEIGAVARAAGGTAMGRRVLHEVVAVAAAEQHPLEAGTRSALETVLTDPASSFGPSMFRDLRAGRPIEATVLEDLADRAREVDTPLLDAAMVVIDLHNRRVGTR